MHAYQVNQIEGVGRLTALLRQIPWWPVALNQNVNIRLPQPNVAAKINIFFDRLHQIRLGDINVVLRDSDTVGRSAEFYS